MACRRATELISASMDRPLTRRERLSLWTHLAICTACRLYRKQLILLREAMRECVDRIEGALAPGEELSNEARDRIRAALQDQ